MYILLFIQVHILKISLPVNFEFGDLNKHCFMFPNLYTKLIQMRIVIPISSSKCERFFSELYEG